MKDTNNYECSKENYRPNNKSQIKQLQLKLGFVSRADTKPFVMCTLYCVTPSVIASATQDEKALPSNEVCQTGQHKPQRKLLKQNINLHSSKSCT